MDNYERFTIGALVIFLVGGFIGDFDRQSKIQHDCEAYGAFVIDGVKYECKEVE